MDVKFSEKFDRLIFETIEEAERLLTELEEPMAERQKLEATAFHLGRFIETGRFLLEIYKSENDLPSCTAECVCKSNASAT